MPFTFGNHDQYLKEMCSLSTSPGFKTLITRVSQKTQKSEFWFATNPTGFHRLDEPPEKISAL